MAHCVAWPQKQRDGEPLQLGGEMDEHLHYLAQEIRAQRETRMTSDDEPRSECRMLSSGSIAAPR